MLKKCYLHVNSIKFLVSIDNVKISRVRKINDKYFYCSLRILISLFKNCNIVKGNLRKNTHKKTLVLKPCLLSYPDNWVYFSSKTCNDIKL